MTDLPPQQKQPGPDTLLGRIRRSVLHGLDTDGSSRRDSPGSPPAVKGWSESLVTISTGVVAIATLATWFFGGARGFPAWVTYVLTIFVAVSLYKYSEAYLKRLLGLLIKFSTNFYFRKPAEEGKLALVKPDDRNSLEAARENYADFVRRFEVFYDEVRLRVGSGERARFEIPSPLQWSKRGT